MKDNSANRKDDLKVMKDQMVLHEAKTLETEMKVHKKSDLKQIA